MRFTNQAKLEEKVYLIPVRNLTNARATLDILLAKGYILLPRADKETYISNALCMGRQTSNFVVGYEDRNRRGFVFTNGDPISYQSKYTIRKNAKFVPRFRG